MRREFKTGIDRVAIALFSVGVPCRDNNGGTFVLSVPCVRRFAEMTKMHRVNVPKQLGWQFRMAGGYARKKAIARKTQVGSL